MRDVSLFLDIPLSAAFMPTAGLHRSCCNALVLLGFIMGTMPFQAIEPGKSTKFQHTLMKRQQCLLTFKTRQTTPHKSGLTRYNARLGGVAERFKAPVLKTGDGASHP